MAAYSLIVPEAEMQPDNEAQLRDEMAALPPPGHDAGAELLHAELDAYPDFKPAPLPEPPPPPPDASPLTEYLGKFPTFGGGQPDQQQPSAPVQRTLDFLAKLGTSQDVQQGQGGVQTPDQSDAAPGPANFADSGQFQGQSDQSPQSIGDALKQAIDNAGSPDFPGLPLAGGPPILPPRPAKDVQPPEATQEKITTGQPLGASDFLSTLTKASQAQGTGTPAVAAAAPELASALGEGNAASVAAHLLGPQGPDVGGKMAPIPESSGGGLLGGVDALTGPSARGVGDVAGGGDVLASALKAPPMDDATAKALEDEAARGWRTESDAAGSGLTGLARGDFAIVPDTKPDTAPNTYALVGPGGHELGGLPTVQDAQQMATRLEATGVDLADPEQMKLAAAHALNGQEMGLAPTPLEVANGLVRRGEPGAELPGPAGGLGDDAARLGVGGPQGAAGAAGGGLAQDADAAARGGAAAAQLGGGQDAADLTQGGQVNTGYALRAGTTAAGGAAGYASQEPQQPGESDAHYYARVAGASLAGAALGFGAGGLSDRLGIAAGEGADTRAGKVLPGMAGTAEQAAQLRPTEPGDAANVLLSKFSPEVQPLLQDAASTFNQFAGQRRGVISDPQAAVNAAQTALGTTVDDWLKSKPGRAFNQEQAIALGQTLDKFGQDFGAARDAYQQALANGTATDTMRADLANRALTFAALEGVRSGAAAEAGRALRAFQTSLDGSIASGLGKDEAVQRAFRAIGTEPEQFQQWTAAWKMIDPADTVGQYKQLQMLYQPSKMSKLLAYTVNNMLSSTKTLEIIGAHGLVQTLNRPVIEALRGDPSVAVSDVAAMGAAVGRAFPNAAEAFLGGVGPTQAAISRDTGWGARADAFPGAAGLVMTPALRAIGGLHEFWLTLNHAGAQAALAATEAAKRGTDVAEVLANPPPTFVQDAAHLAESAVRGGDPSPIGQKILDLRTLATKQGASAAERATGIAAHIAFPFVAIPDFIYRNGMKMLVGPVAYPALAGLHAVQGKPMAQIAGDLKVGGAAAAVDLMMYWLASSGNLTGDGPSDPAKKAALTAATDANGNPLWRPHSVRVLGRWEDYTTAFGPFAVPAAAIASSVEAYNAAEQKPKTAGQFGPVAAEAANATLKALMDSSYIRTFGGVVRSLMDGTLVKADLGQSGLSSLAGNTLGRAVPEDALLAEAARSIDSGVKQPRGVLQQLAARLPFLSRSVPNQTDVTSGRDVQAPQDVGSVLSPAKSEAAGLPNTVAATLAANNVGVATPKSHSGIGLTPDEQQRLARIAGPLIQRQIAATSANPSFGKAPPQVRQQVLQTIINQAHNAAANQVLSTVPSNEIRQRLSTRRGLVGVAR